VRWRHGHAAGGGNRTYHAWKSMLQRCSSSTRTDWPRYGGRGITVSERWHRFENFLADIGECPPGLSLDRINNDVDQSGRRSVGRQEDAGCGGPAVHQRQPV
jgi:hypothetical protein